MTTYRDIVAALTTARVLPYAVEDVSTQGTPYVAFVRFDDLPAEGENDECDAVFAKFAFDVADKGVLFRA